MTLDSSAGTLTKITLSGATLGTDGDAVCADGSVPVIYERSGDGTTNDVVVYFEGGGVTADGSGGYSDFCFDAKSSARPAIKLSHSSYDSDKIAKLKHYM